MVAWWRHQMETFSALLAICAGNSPIPGEFPHKGQWRGALMFSLICARINGWVNNGEAGDLRRYRGHYDVSVMAFLSVQVNAITWDQLPGDISDLKEKIPIHVDILLDFDQTWFATSFIGPFYMSALCRAFGTYFCVYTFCQCNSLK